MSDARIYLASRSPRRRELLKQIGVNFELLLLRESPGRGTDVDETPLPGEAPHDFVLRVTRLKAETAWMRFNERRLPRVLQRLTLLAADTAVVSYTNLLLSPLARSIRSRGGFPRRRARLVPALAAVVRSLDDLAEPAARL